MSFSSLDLLISYLKLFPQISYYNEVTELQSKFYWGVSPLEYWWASFHFKALAVSGILWWSYILCVFAVSWCLSIFWKPHLLLYFDKIQSEYGEKHLLWEGEILDAIDDRKQ